MDLPGGVITPNNTRITELEKRISVLEQTIKNINNPQQINLKLPTIEECYQAIPFPSDERECAMFVAGIAECHKFITIQQLLADA